MQLNYQHMKQLSILLAAILLMASCKKDNNSPANCNRLSSLQASPGNGNTYSFLYEYDNSGRVTAQTEKAGSSATKYNFTYENNGLRILKNNFNTPLLKDSFELNSDGYIIYRVFHFTNGPASYYYTYDGNGFLASETYEYFNTGATYSFAKEQTVYTNTITNGNLVKRIRVGKNLKTGVSGAAETESFEYDESKTGFPEFISANHSGYEFLGKGYGKCSRNAAVKIKRNGVEFNYTYTTDAKGRLSAINGINIGGSSAYSNQKFLYTYTCN
jgi:hypothetical protein